jgi:hypothetical protein
MSEFEVFLFLIGAVFGGAFAGVISFTLAEMRAGRN